MLIDYMYIYLVALILSMFIATDFVETLVENLDQLFNFSVFLMGNLCNLAGYCLIWIEYHMCTIYPKEGLPILPPSILFLYLLPPSILFVHLLGKSVLRYTHTNLKLLFKNN